MSVLLRGDIFCIGGGDKVEDYFEVCNMMGASKSVSKLRRRVRQQIRSQKCQKCQMEIPQKRCTSNMREMWRVSTLIGKRYSAGGDGRDGALNDVALHAWDWETDPFSINSTQSMMVWTWFQEYAIFRCCVPLWLWKKLNKFSDPAAGWLVTTGGYILGRLPWKTSSPTLLLPGEGLGRTKRNKMFFF